MKPKRRLPAPGRRYWSLLGALALCVAIGSAIAIKHHREATDPAHATTPFRFGYQDSPPYQILNKDGSAGGIAIDIVREACRRRGIPVVWVNNEKGPDTALKNGTADLWPIIGDIPERHGAIYVTEPWRELIMCMITRPETGIRLPTDTKGRTVAHVRSRVAANFAGKVFPSAQLVPVITNRNVMEAVVTGQTEAGVIQTGKANSSEFTEVLAQHPDVKIKFYTLQEGGIPSGIGASYIRPDAPAAADAIREEISRMVTDGTISSIYFSYFLDPNNEVSTTFAFRRLHQQSAWLKFGIGILSAMLVLLGLLALLLQRSRIAAKTASRAKSEFLTNMSHEIRTPLNGVNGMIELALDCDSPAQQRDYLVTATQSVETLVTIVNDIIEYSRIEAGVIPIENIPLDLHQLAESCARTYALPVHQKHIELAVDLAPDCPRFIRSDPTRLRQLISNLLGNALKFTEHGEIVLRVGTGNCFGQPGVEFAISDTGIGFSAEKKSQLFQAFEQADNSATRKYGGTGLGLAICRRLIERMHGHLRCESTPGVGSAFYFTIPLIPADTPIPTKPQLDKTTPNTIRALIVDDNATARRILQQQLAQWSIRAEERPDSSSALETIKQAQASGDPFNLLLIDQRMPDTDGLDFVARLNSLKETKPNGVILLLSTDVIGTATARCRELGVKAYILKPVRTQELRAAINLTLAAARNLSTTPAISLTPTASIDPAPTKALRILVAEDNRVNQTVALSLLKRLGHQASLASNGREAVERWRAEPFDLILMDVHMPEMDGLAATLSIRSEEATTDRHIPIAALTAAALPEDEERCRAAGMDAYITKPVSIAKIAAYLATLQKTLHAESPSAK